jgi:hypothetical protein
MKAMTDVLQQYCRTNGIRLEEIEPNFYKTGFRTKLGFFDSFATVDEERNQLTFQTLLPVQCTPAQINNLNATISLINSEIQLGAFKFLHDAGVVIFHTCIMLAKQDIHDETIAHVILSNWSAVNRFYPAIAAVLILDHDPEQAIQLVHEKIIEIASRETKPRLSLRRGNLN